MQNINTLQFDSMNITNQPGKLTIGKRGAEYRESHTNWEKDWAQQVEHNMQVQNGTGPGVRQRERPLLHVN